MVSYLDVRGFDRCTAAVTGIEEDPLWNEQQSIRRLSPPRLVQAQCQLLSFSGHISVIQSMVKTRTASMRNWKYTFHGSPAQPAGHYHPKTWRKQCVGCRSHSWHGGLVSTRHTADRALLTLSAHNWQPDRLCCTGRCRNIGVKEASPRAFTSLRESKLRNWIWHEFTAPTSFCAPLTD